MTTWVVVGVTLAVVALGVAFLSERSPIRADDPAPTATATPTQATTTRETPFAPRAVQTIVPPPCVEEFSRKYAPHPDISLGYTATQCNLRGPEGNYISEAEAFLMMAEWERTAAQSAGATGASSDPALSARSITLADGNIVQSARRCLDRGDQTWHRVYLRCRPVLPRVPGVQAGPREFHHHDGHARRRVWNVGQNRPRRLQVPTPDRGV